MPLPQLPLINGDFYSYADIQFRPGGNLTVGIPSINYSQKLARQYVRGTHRMPLGMTSGQYEPTLDFEMWKPEADSFILALGPGYMQQVFSATVSYGNTALPTVTDTLIGIRIVEESYSNSEGLDAIKVKYTCFLQQILRNGLPVVIVPLEGYAVG